VTWIAVAGIAAYAYGDYLGSSRAEAVGEAALAELQGQYDAVAMERDAFRGQLDRTNAALEEANALLAQSRAEIDALEVAVADLEQEARADPDACIVSSDQKAKLEAIR
jgi:hypothetical protein